MNTMTSPSVAKYEEKKITRVSQHPKYKKDVLILLHQSPKLSWFLKIRKAYKDLSHILK